MEFPARPRISPSAFATGMRVLLLVLNLLILALAAWELQQSRKAQIEGAKTTTQNLAQVLKQNLSGTFRQIDLALLTLRDETALLPGALKDPRLALALRRQDGRLPILEGIRILDPEGMSLVGPPPDADPAAVREFLRQIQYRPDDGLAVSGPLRHGTLGTWSLIFARPIRDAQGSFLGAVCADVPIDRLTQAMAAVDVGPHGSVSLRSADLALLARQPGSHRSDSLIGDTHLSGEYLAAVRNGRNLAHFTARSVLDGERRTYTLMVFGHPRFHILVGLAQSDYLRAWRRLAGSTGLAVAIIVGLTLGMGWMARSAWLRQLADQARLAQEEARFRLLAENALDVVWTLDPQGQLAYISPSIEKQRGWTPEAFMALDPSMRALVKGYGAGMQERIKAAQSAPPGTQPFEDERLQVTAACKDGHEIRVETQWRIVWGEDGTLLGFQGVTRDVTEREQVIGELMQALADVKTLSGMLPICGQCKKIRDDQGYWNSLESYLAQHTEATFTHGLCPECARAFREEIRASRKPAGPDTSAT